MGRRASRALLLAAIVALAFVLRTTHATEVFVGTRVVLAENDPWYHLRRVFLVLRDFPRVPSFDPWIDHPHGAPIVFAPLFDLGLAALARATGVAGDPRATAAMVAFVPPVLGALTCLPTALIAALAAEGAAALPAALLLALLPAHAWYSRIGFVDHHVAVTLLQAILAVLALVATGIGRAPRDAPARIAATLAAIVTLGVGVLAWNGFLLVLAVLDAGLLAAWAASDAYGRRSIARFALWLHAGAALLVLPWVIAVVRETGDPTATHTVSLLHPAVLAAGALLAATGVFASEGGRRGAMAAVVATGLVALAIAVLSAFGALGDARNWLLSRSDPFMGAVQESVPILRTSDGRLDLFGAQVWMTRFFLASPLLLAATFVRAARTRFTDRGRVFLLAWTAPLLALVVLQRRFGETAGPALSVLVADLLVAGSRAFRRAARARGIGPAPARAAAAALAFSVVTAAVWPYHSGFLFSPDRLTSLWRAPVRAGAPDGANDRERAVRKESQDVREVAALARFDALLEREEQAGGAPRGAAGAMNSWPLGHKLLQVAGVPVTATPFGSHVGGRAFEDTADFMLSGDEASALEILSRRGSRWVVLDDRLGTIGASVVARGGNPREWYDRREGPDGPSYSVRAKLAHSTWFRLVRLGGSAGDVPTTDTGSEKVAALDHFRLVVDGERDGMAGFVQAWEVVPGVRLSVRSSPGAEVRASYAWTSDASRPRIHVATARADGRGEARIVLPYSSQREDLGQTSSWRVESDGRDRDLPVGEDAVRGGHELRIDLLD